MFILLAKVLIIIIAISIIFKIICRVACVIIYIYMKHSEKKTLTIKQNNGLLLIEQFHNKVEQSYQQKHNNSDEYQNDISYKILNQLSKEMKMCFSMKTSQLSLSLGSACNMHLFLYPNKYVQLDSIGNELLKEGLELVEALDIFTEENDDIDIK